MNKNILIGIAIGAVVVALGFVLFGNKAPAYPAPTNKAELAELVTQIAKEFKQTYGSVVSTETLQGDRFCFNGICRTALHNTLGASWAGTEGTTTVCSFRAATTSLLKTAVAYTAGNATATYYSWAIGTTPTGSSTADSLGDTLTVANVQDTAIATTTDRVVFAQQYVNLKVAGGTNGTLRPTGACSVELLELTAY